MSETAQVIQAATIREMVKPLGIAVPFELRNYEERDEEEIYDTFGTEVDRILGRGNPKGIEGRVSAGGVSLVVGSVLEPRQSPADGDWEDPHSAMEDSTAGPRRWLSLDAPLHFSGIGVDEEATSGIRLVASETWHGLFRKRPDEPEQTRIDMKVSTLWTPLPASPVEAAFGLQPSTAFTDVPPSNAVWRLHTEAESHHAKYHAGAHHKRAFEIGTEVLRSIDRSMLEIAPL